MKDFPDLQNENAILPLTTASFPDFPWLSLTKAKKTLFPLTFPDRKNPENGAKDIDMKNNFPVMNMPLYVFRDTSSDRFYEHYIIVVGILY